MRELKFAFALTFSALGMWYLSVWSYEALTDARHVEASKTNESPFFRAYHPDKVIEQFWLPHHPCTSGSTGTANSDSHYVHHGLYWETTCIIRANLEKEFVTAIRNEVSRTLDATHSRVTICGDTFEYRSGKSSGSVIIAPLEAASQPLPAGLVNVHIRLTVEEKMSEWF